jgi:hypothetical protein
VSTGAEAGPGTGRSYYATPWELRFRPWALDFTPDDAGNPPYPFSEIVNPYNTDNFLEWTTDDWDPALRFWTLPYDKQLTEWLRSVDESRTYIMAAREFGGQPELWQFPRRELLAKGWLEPRDLIWQPDPELRAAGGNDWTAAKGNAWSTIQAEIAELQQLMEDDRDRYLAEIELQADNGPDYIVAFIRANIARCPWTIELINCGLSIGNIAYSFYKGAFRRVRPSYLCPGLAPPFGPPGHPSFTSGHSFLGHLMALLLLEVPGIQQRYGFFPSPITGAPAGPVPLPVGPILVNIPPANPAVVNWPGNMLRPDDPVCFDLPQKLPSAINPGQIYYVLTSGFTLNTSFQFSTRIGGPAVDTSADALQTYVIPQNPLPGSGAFNSPLMWLSQRLAKNRERLGVHYSSDSNGSRHLAAAVWYSLFHETDPKKRIVCPTLDTVKKRAEAEWPT